MISIVSSSHYPVLYTVYWLLNKVSYYTTVPIREIKCTTERNPIIRAIPILFLMLIIHLRRQLYI